MKNKKGFTLVELMIVMVVIGILLSLLLPGIFVAQQEALKLKTASNLRQIGIAVYAYAKNNNGVLPALINGLPIEGDVLESSFNNEKFNFTATAASNCLYDMNATDDIVTYYHTITGCNVAFILNADGSVETSG